jgi:outer membrane protein assembly factor BamA
LFFDICLNFFAALHNLYHYLYHFVVQDIQVKGLQRISLGTVYNYLPVNVGEKFSQENIEVAAMIMSAEIMIFFMQIIKFERA